MGIVTSWVHVSRTVLEQTLARADWNPASLLAALRAAGVEEQEANELVFLDGEQDSPQEDWNGVLERLVRVRTWDLDKARVLRAAAGVVPGAAVLERWLNQAKSVHPLATPWRSTDVVGFELVATADNVRALLPALAAFRNRAACRAFVAERSRGLFSFLRLGSGELRAWTEDDFQWGTWTRTLEALDAVVAAPSDYLGVATG